MKRSLVIDDDPIRARILALASDLGNTVLTKRAAGDLFRCVISRYATRRCSFYETASKANRLSNSTQ